MRELGEQIQPLFTQVLMACDRLGLIGREWFAIDGVKLPSNASKERSGRPTADHLYWPELDIDLSVGSIRNPEKFPLLSKSLPRYRARSEWQPKLWHLAFCLGVHLTMHNEG